MTLQNLSKILDHYEQQLGNIQTRELELLRGLPFYNFKNPIDANTFNHTLGLPKKNGQEYQLFDYEQLLFNEPATAQTSLDKEGYRSRYNRVHVALYRVALRKRRLIKAPRGSNVYCHRSQDRTCHRINS